MGFWGKFLKKNTEETAEMVELTTSETDALESENESEAAEETETVITAEMTEEAPAAEETPAEAEEVAEAEDQPEEAAAEAMDETIVPAVCGD